MGRRGCLGWWAYLRRHGALRVDRRRGGVSGDTASADETEAEDKEEKRGGEPPNGSIHHDWSSLCWPRNGGRERCVPGNGEPQ